MVLCWPTLASGQVTGRFFLDKQVFAPGEPVILYFEVTNTGTETQNVYQADPYSFCSGYEIRVSSDPGANSSCAPMAAGGSCVSSDVPLEPGKSRTERILLNYEHKVDVAGYYEVEAARQLSYAPAGLDYFSAAKSSVDVHGQLHFHVDENATVDSTAIQSWIEQLRSADLAARREAARTLASLAPTSLEDLLLSFAKNPEFRPWAPLAFYRLNTPRSLEALADLLRNTEAGTYEHVQSADFLAKIGDPKSYPLLLEVAQKHANIANYVDDASESGGDQILPTLLTMMRSPDQEFTQPNAISAFGYTGSRSAVPILLDLLRSSDPSTAERALLGLRQLTHLTIAGERWFDDPQSQYPKWALWWTREGVNAHIYKATECGEVRSLQ
jgi:hypothetical protein